jgi:hypothetical protein
LIFDDEKFYIEPFQPSCASICAKTGCVSSRTAAILDRADRQAAMPGERRWIVFCCRIVPLTGSIT